MAIPVVDFSAMGLQNDNPLSQNGDISAIEDLTNQLYEAFSTIGFVYLKNHGIPQEMMDSVFEETDNFFNLSDEVKQKYSKTGKLCRDGWDAFGREGLNPERPVADHKEAFDFGAVYDEDFNWPNAEVPNFQSNVTSTYRCLSELALRVLSVMAVGLQLKHDVFNYAFQKMGTSQGRTQLRYNCYPTIPDISKVKAGQIRCGEHTDYGAITLLIQDDVGGLEVTNVDGEFVPATPMKGTVVVNIGDMMQRWTSDKLKSTVHRVLIPEVEIKRRVPRRSAAFFLDADADAVITCVDGSNKYPPITSGDWIKIKQGAAYKY